MTMMAANHDDQLGEIMQRCYMSLTIHLALVFHVFIAVAVMVCGRRGCGRRGIGPVW